MFYRITEPFKNKLYMIMPEDLHLAGFCDGTGFVGSKKNIERDLSYRRGYSYNVHLSGRIKSHYLFFILGIALILKSVLW